MLYSMTGFGRSTVIAYSKKITVEIKSLNSKQLDVSLRMPSLFRDSDLKIREMIGSRLERGKIDMNIYVERYGQTEDSTENFNIHFNTPVLKHIRRITFEACQELEINPPSEWFQFFMRFPEAFHSDAPIPTATEAETAELMKAVEESLTELTDYRKTEGIKLEVFFTEKIRNIREYLGEIGKFEKERVQKIRDKIEEGLQNISTPDYDKSRLEQEMIFYIEKLDVSEEKQRLGQHLDYFIETMSQNKPGQGKKLGFISQEMGREINTLGSKSNQADMQKLVVKMKDELEQIKEQVLNVM